MIFFGIGHFWQKLFSVKHHFVNAPHQGKKILSWADILVLFNRADMNRDRNKSRDMNHCPIPMDGHLLKAVRTSCQCSYCNKQGNATFKHRTNCKLSPCVVQSNSFAMNDQLMVGILFKLTPTSSTRCWDCVNIDMNVNVRTTQWSS